VPLRADDVSAEGTQLSILIGPNGSGKSRILGQLLAELEYANSALWPDSSMGRWRKDEALQAEESEVAYELDGESYVIHRQGKNVMFRSGNGELLGAPTRFINKTIAVAHLPVDRFRFSLSEKRGFYSYLGLRQSTNLTTTGALEFKLIQALIGSQDKPGFVQHCEAWLGLLNLQGPGRLKVDSVPREILDVSSLEEFSRVATELINRKSSTGRFPPARERTEEDLKLAWPFFFRSGEFRRSERSVEMPISRQIADPEIVAGLEAARRLRILPPVKLYFERDGRPTPFTDLSSGEQQILGTMVRVSAELEPYSLIAIDEPEVSLHPSWQIRFVPTLRKMLESFPSTHVIIATHSHFMVSDVGQDNSTLVVASNAPSPHFRLFDGETYGRSPENILYRVFGVGSAGNLYVEQDLARALQMISGNLDRDDVVLSAILGRLRRVSGADDEALVLIIEEIENFLAGGE
jgi:energy-coupling factor transporter ATP-binding protein EcfA2